MVTKEEYLKVAYKRMAEKKGHVSFPQLKYPSLRDEGLRDPVQWLTGKAMDDGAEGLWRIYDSLYDLDSFVDKHPGGSEWLELTKGTDITEAFECHHLTNNPTLLLKHYYAREAQTPRNSPFTFKEDGFYKTLQREAREELKKIPMQVSNRSDMILDSLFATFLFSSAMSCYIKSYWMVLFFYLLASLCLAWIAVASHNYIHRRPNWRMYLFSLTTWSYRDFRVGHALSHHLYPNTLMDWEMSSFEPLIWWSPRKDVPAIANYAIFVQLFTFPFSFLQMYFKRLILNFTRKGFFKQHYHWHDNLSFAIPIWIYLVSGCTIWEALTMWLWIICTSSFIFMNIGVNAAHHHPKVFKDGDQYKSENPDWGIFEVETLMHRPDINSSYFRVLTFFGDHALHHLFPTLDHAVLSHLYPIFIKNVKKFKVDLKTATALDMVVGQIQMTLKKEPTVLDTE